MANTSGYDGWYADGSSMGADADAPDDMESANRTNLESRQVLAAAVYSHWGSLVVGTLL